MNMNLLSTNFDCSKYANAKSQGYFCRYYIGLDVRSVHILRIIENMNSDYDEEKGCVVLEEEIVDYSPELILYFEEEKGTGRYKGGDRRFIDWLSSKMSMTEILKSIVDYDDSNGYETYDYKAEYCTVDEMIAEYISSEGKLSDISI